MRSPCHAHPCPRAKLFCQPPPLSACISFDTPRISSHTDRISSHTDRISFHTDRISFHTDRISASAPRQPVEVEKKKDRALDRNEFLQCIIRLAIMRYVQPGTILDVSEAVSQL